MGVTTEVNKKKLYKTRSKMLIYLLEHVSCELASDYRDIILKYEDVCDIICINNGF